jgi:hypothetical protein
LDAATSAFRLFIDHCKLQEAPKFPSLLEHALQQASNIGGFGDMLEDDIEIMHQISGRFESRARKIKGHEK